MPSYSEPKAYKAKLKEWSEAEFKLRSATESLHIIDLSSPNRLYISDEELMAMKARCDQLWAELCQMKGRLLPRDEGGEEP